MAVILGKNIYSLTAQRYLGSAVNEEQKVSLKISSGQRINKAADDAAGLAISETLKSQSRVYERGVRNVNDGISLLNIVDGALASLTDITVRISELAEQAANGSYSATQRKALDKEAQSLSKEFTRIIQGTKFNGLRPLDGSMQGLNIQAGYGVGGSILSSLGGKMGTGDTTGNYFSLVGGGVGGYIYASASGDINGDGNIDVVRGDGSSFSTMLGNGNGTFGAAQVNTSPISGSYQEIILTDVNNDGKLDLVGVADTFEVTVSLGNGNGTFQAATSYINASSSGTALAVGDINNDGKIDIATDKGIRLGNGDGTFQSLMTANLTGGAYTVSLGDINNDGNLDIISSEGDVRIGRGDGTFTNGAALGVGIGAKQIADIGDVNGDGLADVILDGTSGLSLFLGRGNGTFQTGTLAVNNGDGYLRTKLVDLNGDGFLDIVGSSVTDSNLKINLGRGDGTFLSEVDGGGDEVYSLNFADINNDSVLDVIAAAYDGSDGGLGINLSATKDGIAAINPFSLTSRANALQAISIIERKRNALQVQRGTIGAFQARLGTAANVLQTQADEFTAANSRIVDADIAKEAASLTRLQILKQSASSVLAQANQQPALAVNLLK